MKFSGIVGFQIKSVQTKPGNYRPVIEERPYTGDVYQNNRIYSSSTDKQNDDLKLSNRFSIIADLYAQNNLNSIRYVKWKGVLWEVTRINIEFPRIVLDIGGVYHGPKSVEKTNS